MKNELDRIAGIAITECLPKERRAVERCILVVNAELKRLRAIEAAAKVMEAAYQTADEATQLCNVTGLYDAWVALRAALKGGE